MPSLVTRLFAIVASCGHTGVATDVRVHIAAVSHTTSERFLGGNLDACRIAIQNYSYLILFKLVSKFAGVTFRVGGTDADHIYWQINGVTPRAEHHQLDKNNKTYDIALWDSLYIFAKRAGLKLRFDLNVGGSRRHDNTWDSTNTEALFQHIKAKRYDQDGVLQGFQFGNEPCPNGMTGSIPKYISDGRLASDFKAARGMANYNLSGRDLQRLDECCYPYDSLHFSRFVHGAASAALAITIHYYVSPKHCEPEDIINPKSVGKYLGISNYQNIIKDGGFRDVPMVLSETSLHSIGGCRGASNTFQHSLWFLDYLGQGVNHFVLHQLYRLETSNGNFKHVNPDYYVGVLWGQLVERHILDISGSDEQLRLFSACLKGGARTGASVLMLANWDTTAVDIHLLLAGTDGSATPHAGERDEYHLIAAKCALSDRDAATQR